MQPCSGELSMLIARGDHRAEAGRIADEFGDAYGREAAQALFSAILMQPRNDTFVVVTSEELRRFFLRHADWIEWVSGVPYPWS